MTMLIFLTLTFLAVFGAGIRLWTLLAAAFVFALGLCLAPANRSESAVAPPLGQRLRGIWREATGPERLYALLLALILFSLIPLPLPATVAHGRVRYEQNRATVQLLEDGARLDAIAPPAKRFALTRNRAGTWRMLALALAVAGAMAMSARIPGRGKPRMIRLLTLLGAGVGAAALLSLFVWPQGETLLWFLPVAESPKPPLASFENRNHLAGFLAILCPAALALMLRDAMDRRPLRAALSAAVLLIMSAAVFASFSRGGMVSWLIGLAAGTVLLLVRGRSRPAMCAMAAALVVLLAGTLPAPALRARLRSVGSPETESSARTRMELWRDAAAVWRQYPATGAGLNAFRVVQPQVRRDSRSGSVLHAENEYIQTLAEVGIVGTLLIALLWLALAKRAGPRILDVASDDWVVIAAVGAVAAAAAHATVDFPARIPLYALTLAALVGLTLSDADTILVAIGGHTPLLSRHARKLGLLHLAILVLALAQYRAIAESDDPVRLTRRSADDLAQATVWAPSSWHAWYSLGRRACMLNTSETVAWGEQCLTRASECDPENYRLWYQAGMLRMKLGDHAGAQAAFARVRALRAWVKIPDVADESDPANE